MKDRFDRKITYLRLSVTDLCNLRCAYCMPETGVVKKRHSDMMSVEELEEISRAAVLCGIKKIRITGGEPLVRKGIVDICGRISSIPGVEELCMTTNGILLPEYARELKAAGIRRLNISLDTLDDKKYRRLTRIGSLSEAMAGLEAAKEQAFDVIKLNVVLMGGINDDEIPDFVRLADEMDIPVRFIELMPIGETSDWEKERFIKGSAVLKAVPELREDGYDGVAKKYIVPGKKGYIGLINPISAHFCPNCNRIRITADGRLKPCLHSAAEIDLRGLHGGELIDTISSAILSKPERHHLGIQSPSESMRNMNAIGG